MMKERKKKEYNRKRGYLRKHVRSAGNAKIIQLYLLTSSIPLLTAETDTSMRKKYRGGMGGRTIYSVGATNSTLPFASSGRWSASILLPVASRWAK